MILFAFIKNLISKLNEFLNHSEIINFLDSNTDFNRQNISSTLNQNVLREFGSQNVSTQNRTIRSKLDWNRFFNVFIINLKNLLHLNYQTI